MLPFILMKWQCQMLDLHNSTPRGIYDIKFAQSHNSPRASVLRGVSRAWVSLQVVWYIYSHITAQWYLKSILLEAKSKICFPHSRSQRCTYKIVINHIPIWTFHFPHSPIHPSRQSTSRNRKSSACSCLESGKSEASKILNPFVPHALLGVMLLHSWKDFHRETLSESFFVSTEHFNRHLTSQYSF